MKMNILSGMEYKVLNDPIHGFMSFHPLVIAVMDTPQVQRLRNVKQLGVCHFVFPAACHSRFEHSLGTSFLAGKLFDSLKQKRLPSNVEDVDWEKKKLCAQVAGLCHDVGHGPFSHTWEKFRRRCGDKWTHEKESVKIFDEILKEKISPSKNFNSETRLITVNDVFIHYGFCQIDLDIIKKMILGSKDKRNYLYQVVNNSNNGIDVDKWEYIARDSYMLNVPISFDFHRLLNYCCVLANDRGEEEICFREKECSVLAEMFIARGKLHDSAYQHTKVKIIEEMVIDAMILAKDKLKLTETPISKLSDHIFQKILYYDFGDDGNLKKAKNILKRIERRHLYKCIAQENFQGELPEFRKIKACLKKVMGIEQFIDDFGMTTVKVDMTKTNTRKTLNNVLVYDKTNGEYTCKPFNWDEHQNSLKPNLRNLKRDQILLLYKGEEDFPEELTEVVTEQLRNFLIDESTNCQYE